MSIMGLVRSIVLSEQEKQANGKLTFYVASPDNSIALAQKARDQNKVDEIKAELLAKSAKSWGSH